MCHCRVGSGSGPLRREGLKPPTVGLEIRCSKSLIGDGATSYDASDPALTDPLTAFSGKDPDLAAVISAWPGLPEAVRARIVGLVEVAIARESKQEAGN